MENFVEDNNEKLHSFCLKLTVRIVSFHTLSKKSEEHFHDTNRRILNEAQVVNAGKCIPMAQKAIFDVPDFVNGH